MATSPRNVERLPHDRSHLLCLTDGDRGPSRILLDSIDRWTSAMLADDLAKDKAEGGYIMGRVISKQSGVIAGRYVVNRMIERWFQSCSASWSVDEGQMVSEEELILSIEGPSEGVLRCERVVLNIIGRMSGIATETSEWLNTSGGLPVACTRKTEWGLLDTWAVHVGGGLTHRLKREGAQKGIVQISLMWNNFNDLDLHVVCPSSERIHGGNRVSQCGGELDVDMNVRPQSKRPVENVVWK